MRWAILFKLSRRTVIDRAVDTTIVKHHGHADVCTAVAWY